MSEFASLVKQCAVDAVNAQKPDCIVLGRVIQQEDILEDIPLEIMLEQKAVIDRDFLYNTASTYGLKEGERLIMLRSKGGQRYLILDKLREEDEE
jgi:predicted DsbA family dithiol-disulfide isomerase